MLIEEIVRTCVNDFVAQAAVASMGTRFLSDVADRAAACDMSVGAFTALSIDRFLRHGDEAELRSVIAAMKGAQEPVLAGLHRILCIMLVSTGTAETRSPSRMPKMAPQICAWEAERRDIRV